jgi:thiol peroxidase
VLALFTGIVFWSVCSLSTAILAQAKPEEDEHPEDASQKELLIESMIEKMTVDRESSQSGSQVTFKGDPVKLYPGDLKVGDNFLELAAKTDIEFQFGNKVTIISIVPSIDTKVCELQTHKLNRAKNLNANVEVITISRDLPMAQNRFSRKSNMEKIRFYSDYKTASFGKASGLLMQGNELLARAVLVLDQEGIVRYLQVVPETTHFPDIDQAIETANALAAR